LFSAIFVILGWIFAGEIISFITISDNLREKSLFVLKVSLFTFVTANSSVIFMSVLISRQMMFKTSILGMILAVTGFVAHIVS